MSRSSGIYITLLSDRSIIDLVNALLEFGWTFNDHKVVSYLPLGDKDNFNWQREKMSDSELMTLLEKKESADEMVGVVMSWKDTNIGGEFLFYQDMNITFSASMNRRKLSEHISFTDVNWYLEKLIPPLSEEGILIQSIEWEEFL